MERFLKDKLSIDYISQADILAGSPKVNAVLDLLYKPQQDYSKADTMPNNFIVQKLQALNPEV